MNSSLLFVFVETGDDVTEAEFSDWYDNEHAPLRLTVPGFQNALRYKAIDSKSPTWLAIYDIDSISVMSSQEYVNLRSIASQRELDLIAKLPLLQRRVYSPLFTLTLPTTLPSALPGKYLLVAMMQTTNHEPFNKWYEEEHMPSIAKVPGWLRGRRYKLESYVELGGKTDPATAPTPCNYLAIHEFDRTGYYETPEMKSVFYTPWTTEIMKTITKVEVRHFELYKQV